MLEIVVNLTL